MDKTAETAYTTVNYAELASRVVASDDPVGVEIWVSKVRRALFTWLDTYYDGSGLPGGAQSAALLTVIGRVPSVDLEVMHDVSSVIREVIYWDFEKNPEGFSKDVIANAARNLSLFRQILHQTMDAR